MVEFLSFPVKAEKLFDMPMTDYTDFLRAKTEFDAMHIVR